MVTSPEMKHLYTACRWDINGRIHGDNAAAVASKVKNLIQAYTTHGLDAGFYVSGGGATPHQVISALTLQGVRVATPPIFPESRGAEGSTYRNYTLALEWEEKPKSNATQEPMSYEASIMMQGDGGPDWDYIPGVIGEPIFMPKTEGSKVSVIQRGKIVGRGFYFPPDNPIWPNSPPFHGPSASIDRYIVPGPAMERITSWSYTYFFPRSPMIPNPKKRIS
jgi:hypothetical protein